jgi:hypothetical protein
VHRIVGEESKFRRRCRSSGGRNLRGEMQTNERPAVAGEIIRSKGLEVCCVRDASARNAIETETEARKTIVVYPHLWLYSAGKKVVVMWPCSLK